MSKSGLSMAQDVQTLDKKSFGQAPSASSQNDIQSVLLMIHAMKEQMDGMERFVRRRFDEISMEINATSQQLEYAEEGLAGRFSEVLSTISAISFSGSGLTAANTGVELQAVITDTEEAANKILDAADRISQRLATDSQLNEGEARKKFLEETKNDIQDILMACTFQDLTGQRIRKTLESLQLIESQISTTLGELGIEVKADPLEGGVRDSTENHVHSQADIDALFA
jgi:chemotaxis protein CheZ